MNALSMIFLFSLLYLLVKSIFFQLLQLLLLRGVEYRVADDCRKYKDYSTAMDCINTLRY
jgi:hypothetical protein